MDPTALDAVNAALAGETDEPELENTDAGTDVADDDVGALEAGDDTNAAGDAELDDSQGESGGEGTESDQHKGETNADGSVRQRNADGTYKSKEQIAADKAAADAAKPADGKPGEKPGDKPGAKKEPDALNDPIPKELGQATTQRIRTLIDRTKGAEEKATKFETDFNFMVQGIQATGTSVEQYGEVLSFMALFNSGDPKQQGQALEMLDGMADRLATLLGKERTVSDPLKAHADLQQAVQQGRLTKDYATELARTRNQGAFRTELTTAANQHQTQQQQAEQDRAQARNDLNALEAGLKQTDPLYARKKTALEPVLKALLPTIPHREWKNAVEKAFREIKIGAAPVRPQPQQQQGGVKPRVPGNQPMRANRNPSGAGGGSGDGGSEMKGSGPASMLDAVSSALASMK